MKPILFKIVLPFLNIPIEVRSYGIMIALGFLLMLPLITRLAKKEGIHSNTFIDIAFWSLLWGLIGARILFIITNLHEYIQEPLRIFALWEGGLVFYGGLIGGALTIIFYCKKKNIPLWKMLDVAAPGVAFVHMFGRLGCVLAGCCFGKPTTLPWGISFHLEESFARPLHTPLHPTQLYEALALFFVFLLLYFYLSSRKKFDGQMVLVYFILYSIFRFTNEFFRGDEIRGFVFGWVSTSQFISLLVFGITLFFLFHSLRGLKKEYLKSIFKRFRK
ncbi:MAG: prolipoprotein diacylglyceryl transferase [Deltaproteobacteria bacterium]|nr:prolipoprotein diacylglyceryl transferase [Deltaproteobacteria bacterium]